MSKSLLVFAVSFTPEMPNFGAFGGVAHPFKKIKFFKIVFIFDCVYAHISNLNYKNILVLKK